MNNIISLDLNQLIDLSLSIKLNLINKIKILLKDKSSSIRFIAMQIAEKLKLKDELLKIGINDPYKENRKFVIKVSEINHINIKMLFDKLYDADYEIRLETLKKIYEYGFMNLTLEFKRIILFLTVTDRVKQIRNFSMNSIQSFIKEFGIEQIMDIIELEFLNIKQQKELHIFLRELCMDFENIDLENMISQQFLQYLLVKSENSSKILLARILIEALFKKNQSILFKILPASELIALLEYQHPFFQFFFTQNILKICACLETQEE